MVLPETAVGPLVGPLQGTSVLSASLMAAWARARTAGQPLGCVGESPGPLDEPRSQPARTVVAASRVVTTDRAFMTPGVALRLPCTGAPRGGMGGTMRPRAPGDTHGADHGAVPAAPPSPVGEDGGGGAAAGESRAATAPVRRRRAE